LDNIFLYIGTISSWFDFESIILMLDKNESANFVLIGPVDISIPKHNRLHYFGTFSRDYLPFFMLNAHVLTMPFKVNQLIESVDPVKIYEYIGLTNLLLLLFILKWINFRNIVICINLVQTFLKFQPKS